jgi:hypothetical protein
VNLLDGRGLAGFATDESTHTGYRSKRGSGIGMLGTEVHTHPNSRERVLYPNTYPASDIKRVKYPGTYPGTELRIRKNPTTYPNTD